LRNPLQAKQKLQKSTDEKSLAGRLFVPSLTLACFSLFIVDSLTGVFLLDLTVAFFGSPDPALVAITSQLGTVSSVVSVIFGLLLGALSIRFNHKKLLVLGTFCITLAALGCFLAPNFFFLQIFYAIEGIGTIVANTMAIVLVGEILVLSERPKAIGWLWSGSPIAGIAANLVIIFFFSGAGGWRSFLLLFALPVSLIASAAAYFGVPSQTQRQAVTVGKGAYLSSYKQVFLKKSAAACLVGNMIKVAGAMWVVYLVAFLITRFSLPLAEGALVMMGVTVIMAIAHPAGGYLVNKVGRKNLLVTTTILQSAVIPLIAFVPDLWVAIGISWSAVLIGGLGMPASVNLALEQVPESRGTMMSINNILMTVGFGIATAVGGLALAFFNYTGMFLTFAAIGFAAAAIFFFLTEDPCRP
jgi:MFS family permease